MKGDFIMVFSNADKAKHGKSAQDSLANILKRSKDAEYIVKVKGEYRIGKKAMETVNNSMLRF